MSCSSSCSCSSSFSIPRIASTLLLLLLLIPSLKILINGLNSLSTFVLCIFFKAPPCVLLSLLKGLKLPADAFLGACQGLAEAFRSILASLVDMVLGILGWFLMAVLGFVKSVVFGSLGESGSGLGDLLEKAKASWEESLLERVREIVGSLSEMITKLVLDMAGSSAGGLFSLAKTGILKLFNEPDSTIKWLVETLKGSFDGSSSIEGVRGIVGSFIDKVVSAGLGLASTSTVGWFGIVKNVIGAVIDSGYTLGGLLEKTRVALQVLRMEDVRTIIKSIANIGLNLIISYFIG